VEVARIIYKTDNEMGVMTSTVSLNEMVLPPAADGDQPEDVVWVQVDNNQITQFLDLLHKCPDAWTDAGVRDALSVVELYGGGILQCFFCRSCRRERK
jgi:hypothetical protein